MAEAETVRVEVLYAAPGEQIAIRVSVPRGASVLDSIQASGLLRRHPDADPIGNGVGIFGRLCAPDEPVRSGDRIEVYRPLTADAKELRRRRAAKRE